MFNKKKKEINKLIEFIEKSGFFDKIFYLRNNHDVRVSDFIPIEHYCKYGIKEDRWPNSYFDPTWYKNYYVDIKKDDVYPLVHFISFGDNENRFMNEKEMLEYESLKNDSSIDLEFYKNKYDDLKFQDEGFDILLHYIRNGKKEGRILDKPNRDIVENEEYKTFEDFFDKDYYLNNNPDVKVSNVCPIEHYSTQGWKEDRKPNDWFEPQFYVDKYPDVLESELEPLAHYIEIGRFENRETKFVKEIKDTDYFEYLNIQNNKSPDFIEYENKEKVETDIKLIAYYLPQFHPIPQNDYAWGKGFTEWTNVSKALPQFEGHYQPRLPAELGYYDLRLKEVQKRQIELAKNYGLHGFCYHYYWFDGEKVMDTPLQQVLDNPDLDFPFCINWANENWTKRWDGLDNDVILAQNHTLEDDLLFLENIKPILCDKRYIKINNKSVLMIYRPNLFPNIKKTVKRWREHAKKIGIGELYLIVSHSFEHINPEDIGFDAAAEFAPNSFKVTNVTNHYDYFNNEYEGNLYDYKSAIDYSISYEEPKFTKFRSLCPSWDNEARKPGKGTSFVNANPDNYSKWLEYILYYTEKNRKKDEKLVFINAWNEWAEGAYLEPDRKYGYAYLEKTYNQLSKFSNVRLYLLSKSQMNIKKNDTAVIIHLYYIELWDEIKNKLIHLDNKFDLFININNNSDINFIKKVIEEFPNARIYSCENRGRDILPFIQMMKDILPLKYKYACKIHSKKSLHRTDGDQWRDHLIDSLLISKDRIDQSKNHLDTDTGVVVAKNNIFSYRDWIGSNEEMVNKFANKSNIKIPNDFVFPAGSMFWFNPIVFEPLIQNLNENEFVYEQGQIDGTIAHAIERFVGLLCNNFNLKIREI